MTTKVRTVLQDDAWQLHSLASEGDRFGYAFGSN